MRTIIAAGAVLGAVLMPAVPAHAVVICDETNTSCTPCDRDPLCNSGRGAIRGYACYRNEASPVANAGNGRVCFPGQGHTVYVYTRGLCNRSVAEVYVDGTDAFAPDLPPHC